MKKAASSAGQPGLNFAAIAGYDPPELMSMRTSDKKPL